MATVYGTTVVDDPVNCTVLSGPDATKNAVLSIGDADNEEDLFITYNGGSTENCSDTGLPY